MRPEVASEEKAAGSWPYPVTIVRSARLSEDLALLTNRRVDAIRIYHQNDVALALSVEAAAILANSLLVAVEQARRGPLGDLAEEPS